MAQITGISNIIERCDNADCSPRFESIIAQKYIGSIWAHSDKIGTVFAVTVNKQFVGTMHPGTDHEFIWTEETCGWLEDGIARKGQEVSFALFDDFSEALAHLMEETKRLTAEVYGSLKSDDLAV